MRYKVSLFKPLLIAYCVSYNKQFSATDNLSGWYLASRKAPMILTSWYSCLCIIPFYIESRLAFVTGRIWWKYKVWLPSLLYKDLQLLPWSLLDNLLWNQPDTMSWGHQSGLWRSLLGEESTGQYQLASMWVCDLRNRSFSPSQAIR